MTKPYLIIGRPLYVVCQHGDTVYSHVSLTHCLRFIGQEVRGKSFGRLLATVGEAMQAGFSITVC